MTDFTVHNHGSVVLLEPNTPQAEDWLNEHIGQDNGYQPRWPTALIEPRYVADVLSGAIEDGLTF